MATPSVSSMPELVLLRLTLLELDVERHGEPFKTGGSLQSAITRLTLLMDIARMLWICSMGATW